MKKTVIIIDKEKSRQKIIEDIQSEAKTNCNYNQDTMYRRMRGIKDLEENQFYFMVRKILKSEVPEVRECIFCKTDRFEKYIEMC